MLLIEIREFDKVEFIVDDLLILNENYLLFNIFKGIIELVNENYVKVFEYLEIVV